MKSTLPLLRPVWLAVLTRPRHAPMLGSQERKSDTSLLLLCWFTAWKYNFEVIMFLMLVGSDLINFSPGSTWPAGRPGPCSPPWPSPVSASARWGDRELSGVQWQQALARIVQSRDQLDVLLCFGRYFREGDFYSGPDILSKWPLDIQNVFSLIVPCSNVFCRLPSEPHMHVALSH